MPACSAKAKPAGRGFRGVLDVAAAAQKLAGDMALVRRLLRVRRRPAACAGGAAGALAAADAAALAQASHSLLGAARVLAAADVAKAAARLEELAAAGRLDKVPAALAELEAHLERLRPALAEELTDTP